MQITESLTKDGLPSLDSDYRINPNNPAPFNQQSSTDEPSSSMKPPSSDADSIPGFTSPPPTSFPPPRSTPAKGNMRGKNDDKLETAFEF